MKKQRKLVTQQRFTRQELEQQQRNSAVKDASPVLFCQLSEDKGFLQNQLKCTITISCNIIVITNFGQVLKWPIKLQLKCLL